MRRTEPMARVGKVTRWGQLGLSPSITEPSPSHSPESQTNLWRHRQTPKLASSIDSTNHHLVRCHSVVKGLFTCYVSQNQGFLDPPPSAMVIIWLTPPPPLVSFRQHLPNTTFLLQFLRRLVYMIKWRIFIC